MAAAVTIYAGALVARPAAGHAAPATEAADLVALGRAEERADNSSGADGAVRCRVRRGTFRWANSGGADKIAAADIGNDAYMVDDQTVAKTPQLERPLEGRQDCRRRRRGRVGRDPLRRHG